MNVAIIPARGGSKRIPRKNIRQFHGKPMVAWSIEEARKSGLFDEIFVSTDDAEIASIAMEYGAKIPFFRPQNLADDYTTTVPVVAHAISSLRAIGIYPDFVCCIYPCAPFLRSEDLIGGLELLKQSGASFSYAIAEYSHPAQRALMRKNTGHMYFLYPKHELARTQDLAVTYYDLGQFYWGGVEDWSSQKRMHSDGAGLVLPNWRFVDIDTHYDWKRAELLFEILAHEGVWHD